MLDLMYKKTHRPLVYALIASALLCSNAMIAVTHNRTYARLNIPHQLPHASQLAHELKQLYTSQEYARFLFGASTSEHQYSKQCTPDLCSWSRFADTHNLLQPKDHPSYINLWDHYRTYIPQAKQLLGINSLRISIEMALVYKQDRTGAVYFDEDAVEHYAQLFVYLIKEQITPIICFHHYTDPIWFIDQGGFEHKKNSDYFVQFCTHMYTMLMHKLDTDPHALHALQHMAPKQPLFATFNSPEGYAFKAYRERSNPPANPKKQGLKWAVTVLGNVLQAHTRVYHALHHAYTTMHLENRAIVQAPYVGILKNIHQLEPAHRTAKHRLLKPLSSLACTIGNKLQNKSVYTYLTTGQYDVQIPGAFHVSEHDPLVKDGVLDWIGLNYYSNGFIAGTKKITEKNSRYQTENRNYRVHPAGLYQALMEIDRRIARPLSIPIYVTENGIATHDDRQRTHFYQSYLYALMRARHDGCPVYGYLTWSLCDNYEWPGAHIISKCAYGLLRVHPDQTLTIKPGSQWYADCVKTFFKTQDSF